MILTPGGDGVVCGFVNGELVQFFVTVYDIYTLTDLTYPTAAQVIYRFLAFGSRAICF